MRTVCDFLSRRLSGPVGGEPEFTFCDVERAVQREIRKRNYVERYELKAAESLWAVEMAILERLEAKYRPAAPPRTQDQDVAAPVAPSRSSSAIVLEAEAPAQGTLF